MVTVRNNNRTGLRALCVFLVCLMACGNTCPGAVASEADIPKTTLSPTTPFNPLVRIVPGNGGYEIIDDPSQFRLLRGGMREDAAFLCIGQIISQGMRLDISTRGIQLLITGYFSRSFTGAELAYLNRRFLWHRMYCEDGAVCLPYARKHDGLIQTLKYYLPSSETPEGAVEFGTGKYGVMLYAEPPAVSAGLMRSIDALAARAEVSHRSFAENRYFLRKRSRAQFVPIDMLIDPRQVTVPEDIGAVRIHEKSRITEVMRVLEDPDSTELEDVTGDPVRIEIKEDGKIWIMEGMHRILALKAMGVELVPAHVVYANDEDADRSDFLEIPFRQVYRVREKVDPARTVDRPDILGGESLHTRLSRYKEWIDSGRPDAAVITLITRHVDFMAGDIDALEQEGGVYSEFAGHVKKKQREELSRYEAFLDRFQLIPADGVPGMLYTADGKTRKYEDLLDLVEAEGDVGVLNRIYNTAAYNTKLFPELAEARTRALRVIDEMAIRFLQRAVPETNEFLYGGKSVKSLLRLSRVKNPDFPDKKLPDTGLYDDIRAIRSWIRSHIPELAGKVDETTGVFHSMARMNRSMAYSMDLERKVITVQGEEFSDLASLAEAFPRMTEKNLRRTLAIGRRTALARKGAVKEEVDAHYRRAAAVIDAMAGRDSGPGEGKPFGVPDSALPLYEELDIDVSRTVRIPLGRYRDIVELMSAGDKRLIEDVGTESGLPRVVLRVFMAITSRLGYMSARDRREILDLLVGPQNGPEEISEICVEVASSVPGKKALTRNSARYYDAAGRRAVIVFDGAFFDAMAERSNEDAGSDILAERLVHELCHDNRKKNPFFERTEETRIVCQVDIPFYRAMLRMKGHREGIDRLRADRRVKSAMGRSGEYFRALGVWAAIKDTGHLIDTVAAYIHSRFADSREGKAFPAGRTGEERGSDAMTIQLSRSFTFPGAVVEQREYPLNTKAGGTIYPVVKVTVNGEERRVGAGYYLVVTLSNGKKIYWGGQHNLSYSFFFEHFRERASGIINDGGIEWRHIDAHGDFGRYVNAPLKRKKDADWREEVAEGYRKRGIGDYLGYLASVGIASRLYRANSLDPVKTPVRYKHVAIPEKQYGLRQLAAEEINGGVTDLDIDVVVGTESGMEESEAVARFMEMKPYLVSVAMRGEVSFLVNSSELSRTYLGVPLHINPHLGARFNGEIIEAMAEIANAAPSEPGTPEEPVIEEGVNVPELKEGETLLGAFLIPYGTGYLYQGERLRKIVVSLAEKTAFADQKGALGMLAFELTVNVLEHGRGGIILVKTSCGEDGKTSFVLESLDDGRGIYDPVKAEQRNRARGAEGGWGFRHFSFNSDKFVIESRGKRWEKSATSPWKNTGTSVINNGTHMELTVYKRDHEGAVITGREADNTGKVEWRRLPDWPRGRSKGIRFPGWYAAGLEMGVFLGKTNIGEALERLGSPDEMPCYFELDEEPTISQVMAVYDASERLSDELTVLNVDGKWLLLRGNIGAMTPKYDFADMETYMHTHMPLSHGEVTEGFGPLFMNYPSRGDLQRSEYANGYHFIITREGISAYSRREYIPLFVPFGDLPLDMTLSGLKNSLPGASKGTHMPPGSIYSVFRYLADKGITGEEHALTAEEIAEGLASEYGRPLSPASIKDDLRALALHLRILESTTGRTGPSARYYLAEDVAAKKEGILPLLSVFRGDGLRPTVDMLEDFYGSKIKPLLRSGARAPAYRDRRDRLPRAVTGIEDVEEGQIVHFKRTNRVTNRTVIEEDMTVHDIDRHTGKVTLQSLSYGSHRTVYSYFPEDADSVVRDEIYITGEVPEKRIVEDFMDMVKIMSEEAAQKGQKIIVGIGTGWMKGYGKKGSDQYKWMNAILAELRNGRFNNVIFVDVPDKDLAAALEDRARDEGTDYSNVIALGRQDVVTGKAFKTLREGRALVAGVDTRNFEYAGHDPQIRLFEMLRVLLAISGSCPLLEDMDISRYYPFLGFERTGDRTVMFCPKAEYMDIRKYRREYTFLKYA